jgi:hypothetical protein
MRPAPAALSVLVALAVMAAADPASAATAQTAQDLTVKKAKLQDAGFKRIVSPGLKKGPVTLHMGTCAKLTLVPKGGTVSSEAFEQVQDSPDSTQELTVDVTLTDVLTPTIADAASVIAKLKSGLRKCGAKIGSAPALSHATHGFVETDSYGGTTTINHLDVPTSGSSQVAFYQRGRAIGIVTLDDVLITGSADHTSASTIEHIVNGETKSLLKETAKLVIKSLGAQTAS